MANQISDLYEFGSCRLDVVRRVLTCDSHPVSLAPKTFALLLLLVQSRGRALSKQELMSALWPDVSVEEANLSFQIAALRKALGSGASQWVETIPKYGYRFAGDVRAVPVAAAKFDGGTPRVELPGPTDLTRSRYRWRWIAGLVGLLAIISAMSIAFLKRPTAELKP